MKKQSLEQRVSQRNRLFVLVLAGAIFTIPASAQVFEIGNQNNQSNAPKQQPKQPAKKGAKKSAGQEPPASAPQGGIGWGNSIEVGRNARAAQDALKHNNPAQAAIFAKRATDAAPQELPLWLLYGYTARLAGHLSESENAYHSALARDSASLDAKSGLAQTYQKMGRADEAKRLLTEVVNTNPKRVNDLLVLGELYMQSGDSQRGIDYLQRAETQQPSAHAELLMAVAYLKLKQPARAKQLLDMAKKRDPKNVDIFRAVATYQRESHDYQAAIATLKSAPRMTPEVLADLGYSYEVAGNKEEAAKTYERAASGSPGNINLQLSAASADLRLNDFAKTGQFLSRAAAIDPDHYRLHAIRGALAKAQSKNEEAIREYEAAVAKMPESVPEGLLYPVQLRLNLAELYKDAGNDVAANQQVAAAEQQMAKINVEGPAKAEFLRVRAAIRVSGNKLAEAEADLKEAMRLDPQNANIELQYANLLWKQQRKDDAKKMYLTVLNREPKNRYALESLGYLARDMNNIPEAEGYFHKLAQAYPSDYIAYLALGDMYTSLRKFDQAIASYETAYKNAPRNATVVANGANAAIEARKFEIAKTFLDRASGPMNDDAHVMLERERYLLHVGKYLESAQLGYKVLAQLPKDRNASVYLAYDLYNLGRYDDVLQLASKYELVLPKEPNFPLLEGHVHKQSQLLDASVEDYSRAIERDPNMIEAYVNRGYVYNDLQNAEAAISDFTAALKAQPNNAIAHLGAAFANLELRRGKPALDQVEAAVKLSGESGATHLARATAYRQMRQLEPAETEYRAALKFAPDDIGLHTALADTLYHERKYTPAIDELSAAVNLAPDDALLYAQRAQAEAAIKQDAATMRDVKLAEDNGPDESAVLLATGNALLTLGDRDGAMARFMRALDAPDSNRVDARLSFARLFARDGKFEDARQQISLAFTEARIGETAPVTADNLVEAANIFLQMHDFDLAEKIFDRAKEAGAGDGVVAVGLANTYLAQGDDRRAEAELSGLGDRSSYAQDYDYMMAMGNMYRQQRNMGGAVAAFARANQLGSDDQDLAAHALHEAAAQEGLPVTGNLNFLSDFSIAPIFDDSTIYQIDAQLFTANGQLPAPRSSTETRITSGYRAHVGSLPEITGFVQLRNASGKISLPSAGGIINRNTFDTSFNSALNPVVRLGSNKLAFNGGLQFTLRRDKDSPVDLNQNLFRQFLYMDSSSFFNWIAVRGEAFHEGGGFTERSLSSSERGGRIEFQVGRPWGSTALITGYSVRDLQFHPLIREFFTTSSYAGLQHRFGRKLTVTALAELVRSWQVQDLQFGRGQALTPGGRVDWRPSEKWSVNGQFSYQSGRGASNFAHTYDNVQSAFYINYLKPLHQKVSDGVGVIPAEYPIQFSFGIEQQKFFNFTGSGQTTIFRPVIRLTIF